jgi:hypothetical protein
MYQIYLLTTVANMFVGFLVADSFFRAKQVTCGVVLNMFTAANTKLAISLGALLIGIIALFKPHGVIFIGDLLPAIGAIVGGLIIGSRALSDKSDEPPAFVHFVTSFTEKISTPLGLGMMAIGLLHAIVPTAVIL